MKQRPSLTCPFPSAEPLDSEGRQADGQVGAPAENQAKGLTFLPLRKSCKAVGHIIDFRSWPLCYYLVLQENFGAKNHHHTQSFYTMGTVGVGGEWTDCELHTFVHSVCVSAGAWFLASSLYRVLSVLQSGAALKANKHWKSPNIHTPIHNTSPQLVTNNPILSKTEITRGIWDFQYENWESPRKRDKLLSWLSYSAEVFRFWFKRIT